MRPVDLKSYLLVCIALLLVVLITRTEGHEPVCADGWPHGIPTTPQRWKQVCHEQDCICVDNVQVFHEGRGEVTLRVDYRGERYTITEVPASIVETSMNHEEYVCLPNGRFVAYEYPYYEIPQAPDNHDDFDIDLNLYGVFVNRGLY